MLTLFRRHLKKCKHATEGRKYRSCACPLSVEGTLRGEPIRKSLDLRNWEAAVRLIRDWEFEGKDDTMTARKAVERFLADRKAMNLSDAMMGKYRRVGAEIEAAFGDLPLRSITTDDVRKLRESWQYASITAQKKMGKSCWKRDIGIQCSAQRTEEESRNHERDRHAIRQVIQGSRQ